MALVNDGEIIDVDPEPRQQLPDTYRSQVPSHPLDADPAEFARQLQRRGDNYASLVGWLVENLDPSADVVQVHFVKRANCDQGGPPACTPTICPWHWSDPDLSRSGVEKVCGLLGLGARFLGMQDFRRKALQGVKLEHVIVDCELYNSADGPAVSQGTGACSIDEVDGSLNNAMKRACKRAMTDALKRCAGLSGLAAELKRRMSPTDPDAARKQAEDAQRRARYTGEGGGKWNTGAKLTHCPIGRKHKDKPWREVPSDFLQWIIDQVLDKPDVSRAAAEELSKRRDSAPRDSVAGSGSSDARPPPASDDEPPPFDDEIPY